MEMTAIREAVIAGESDKIRQLLLTGEQLRLLKYIARHGPTTASKLAKKRGLSIQNASSKLMRLCWSGYLARESRSAETGGIEFVYDVVAGLCYQILLKGNDNA